MDDAEVKSEVLHACHSIITGNKEFVKHFEEWSKSELNTSQMEIP